MDLQIWDVCGFITELGGVLFLTQAWVLIKWKFTQVHI